MSLFPSCEFTVHLDEGGLVPGRPNHGRVELELFEAIPRAERLEITLKGIAFAGYGSGTSRSTYQRTFVDLPLTLALPAGGLPAGTHVYPFTLHVPANLPQSYAGQDCSMKTSLELRLDVDWALDPTSSVPVLPRHAPQPPASPQPLALRSHPSFHDAIALEITLVSNVVARGVPLVGSLALRAGHEVSFSSLSLVLGHHAVVRYVRGDVREVYVSRIAFHLEALRAGRTIPFELATGKLPFTQSTGLLDLGSFLRIELDPGLLSSTRRMQVPVVVLPQGTLVLGASAPVLVGSSRLRDLAARLAADLGLGLVTGELPVLVEGQESAVGFTVQDGPRGAELGAVVTLRYPPLWLGLRSRAAGLLTRETEETPPPLRGRWALRTDPASPHVTRDHCRALLDVMCSGLERAELVELADDRLSFRLPLASDDATTWRDVVLGARRRARTLADAIDAMPVSTPGASEAAWRAAAREEGATLLPHCPALVGITRTVRLLGGEARTFSASIDTVFASGAPEPRTQLHVHVPDVPLPPSLSPDLEGLRALRALLPEVEIASPHLLSASCAGAVADPRTLLPALDAAIRMVLEARGDRVASAPYR
jgi:hypothetical protein